MPNSINSLSPDLRDFLLNRNIISDTIISSGLNTLLQGIGIPSEISHSPEAVQPSENIEADGVFYKDLNVIINKYQGTDNDYEKISINYLPGNTNSTWAGTPYSHEPYYAGVAQLYNYTSTNVPANGPFQGGDIREFTTAKNNYLDVTKQTKIDFNTQPVPTYQIGSYLDEFGNLNVGGPSSQPLDIVGSLLNGGGVGFNPNDGGAVADFDVRSSLAGRVLNGAGLINDTKIGQLSVYYLAASIGNNIAFNLQQETIGAINTNPLSLLKGNSLIVPNYNITVAPGTFGVAIDLLERMVGFETPVSLLKSDASIFASESGDIGNFTRANEMIKNSGKGQVLSLFANLNANIDPKITRGRQGYVPLFEDPRTKRGFNQGPLSGGTVYAYAEQLNNDSALVGKYPVQLSNDTTKDGINSSEFGNLSYVQQAYMRQGTRRRDGSDMDDHFIWSDLENNKSNSNDSSSNDINAPLGAKKSLLSKTRDLFNSNKMKTLTTGHYVKDENISEIQTSAWKDGAGNGKMSKGSGVLSAEALNGKTDGKIFCRTWTSYDKYASVGDLQKNSGLKKNLMTNPNANVDASVLDKQGFVQIGPYNDSKNGDNVEKYMFSIENLAWHGSDMFNTLPSCEIGPGDPMSGNKGRIMWFPPYDISFNETTSVSLERNNFIGRGEPVYTYNNTERTGTLSWKIIIDHPNYANYFPSSWGNDEIASFYAGCLENDEIAEKILTGNELNEMELANKSNVKETTDDTEIDELKFNIYFTNDGTAIPSRYENGLKNGDTNDPTGFIDYLPNPMGCYNFKFTNGNKECENGYGLGTTQGEGIVGGEGTTYNDRTNFGFNGQNQPISVGNEKYKGWLDDGFTAGLSEYISNECKYCKIKINGYASQQGSSSKNVKLSKKRAENVKSWLTSVVLPKDDEFGSKRVVIAKPSGEGEITGQGCTGEGGQDRRACKTGRKVTITLEYDAALKEASKSSAPKKDTNESSRIPTMHASRFFKECDYFTRLEQSSPTAFSSIKEKIPFFHPSFHSTTPEGFNSRLTFLQQCTRQGPTLNGYNPNNLAFGRPPVCILRVGDFYNTKIMIESLTVDYEPLVWDLNPEGVGVQPMIANVTMSFVFIGGSSLNGPIGKLQNAVSFNYFANTELYDVRSDRYGKDGKLINGEDGVSEEERKRRNTEQIVEDQKAVADEEIIEADPTVIEGIDKLALTVKSVTSYSSLRAGGQPKFRVTTAIKVSGPETRELSTEDWYVATTVELGAINLTEIWELIGETPRDIEIRVPERNIFKTGNKSHVFNDTVELEQDFPIVWKFLTAAKLYQVEIFGAIKSSYVLKNNPNVHSATFAAIKLGYTA